MAFAWPHRSPCCSVHVRVPQVVVSEGGLKKEESEFNAEFTKHLLAKLDWAALATTAADVRSVCLAWAAVAVRRQGLARSPHLTTHTHF